MGKIIFTFKYFSFLLNNVMHNMELDLIDIPFKTIRKVSL